jgi:hypothetical protein
MNCDGERLHPAKSWDSLGHTIITQLSPNLKLGTRDTAPTQHLLIIFNFI